MHVLTSRSCLVVFMASCEARAPGLLPCGFHPRARRGRLALHVSPRAKRAQPFGAVAARQTRPVVPIWGEEVLARARRGRRARARTQGRPQWPPCAAWRAATAPSRCAGCARGEESKARAGAHNARVKRARQEPGRACFARRHESYKARPTCESVQGKSPTPGAKRLTRGTTVPRPMKRGFPARCLRREEEPKDTPTPPRAVGSRATALRGAGLGRAG